MDDDSDDDVAVSPSIEFGAVFEVQPDSDPALETSPRVIELVSREHAPVLAAGLGLLGALGARSPEALMARRAGDCADGADDAGVGGEVIARDDAISIPLASKKTGFSERQLRRFIERGELASTRVEGRLRLSRREIDDLAAEDDRDGQLFESAARLVDLAQGQVRDLVGVLVGTLRSVTEVSGATIRDLREDKGRLEEERERNRSRVERAESQAAERELLAEAHAAQIMREDRASQAHAKMIERLGPVLASYALPALAKYAGIEPPPASALTPADVALRAVVSSLRPEQLQAVASSGVLDDTQIAAIARAWEVLHAVPGVVSGDPSGNGSSSGDSRGEG